MVKTMFPTANVKSLPISTLDRLNDLSKLRGCVAVRRSEPYPSGNVSMGTEMSDKVWLTDAEVGTRFGSTRQWVSNSPLKVAYTLG